MEKRLRRNLFLGPNRISREVSLAGSWVKMV